MPDHPRWRFGPFVADSAEQQLTRDGQVVPVTRKALALLATLLARPGKLVTKDELFDIVWAGTVVTDAALSRAIRELRVALGDDATTPTYIATAHGLGFRFVAPVQAMAPADAPAAPEAAAAPQAAPDAGAPFAPPGAAPPSAASAAPDAVRAGAVGRSAEIVLLQRLAQGATDGQRHVVLVSGAAGIGKTALVEAFLARYPRDGAWVAVGRCIERFGTGEPYLPLLEALEALSRQVGAARMGELLLRYAPAWLAQLPWLAHDTDAQALQRALAGNSTQRMLREVTQVLEVLAAERPLVLWLEDLHWSDPSTLDVVAYLAGRREPARLLVLASLRPGELGGDGAALRALTQQLVQRGLATELPLSALDEPAVAAYLRQRVPPAPGLPLAALARFVHRRTEGHALFTVAMVDDLVRRGDLRPGAQGWTLNGPVDQLGTGLPDNLRLLVQRQIDQLGDADRRLVEAAAVAGADFSAAAVAAALQAEVADVEERALRLLQAGRFLRHRAALAWPDGTESAGFGFVHALYWQGTYEGIAPGRRAEWQLRIAQHEERAWGGQVAQVAAELAMRFEAARDAERALHYLRLAGHGALQRCAYRECADHLQHALTLVERLPGDQRERRELELLLTLGAAQMALQGYASDDVDQTYRRALALCRRCARPGELERTLRGQWNVALVRSELDQAQLAADELLLQASAAGDRAAAFDAFAKLGQTAMHRGDFAASRRHLEHALALPLPVDDPMRERESPRVLAYLAWVLWYAGFADQALRRADEALALAAQARSPHSSAFALGFVGWLHVFRGDAARMRPLALQQATLALEHGLVYWKVWSDMLLGLAAGIEGGSSLAAARGCEDMAAALEAFSRQDAEVGVSHFLCELAAAQLACGNLDGARAAVAQSAAMLDGNGNTYHAADTLRLQGEVARAAGDAAQAQAFFESALRQARLQRAPALELRAAMSLARLWLQQDQAELAAALLAPLRRQLTEGAGTADLRQADALLAELAAIKPRQPTSASSPPAAR
ncbi:MAG: AAA family ATPase [Aquabacterium sp.]